jgi:D-3-phosphoglycerate dehydrogenase
MRVIAYDPYLPPIAAKQAAIRLVDKEAVFRDSDVLSIHAALTPETQGAVGATELRKMRPNAILVNCARGEIVDEAALAEALRARTISGAAIDVFTKEPPTGSPLLDAPNIVFTPHLGASTVEGQARAGAIVADQVLKVLAGKRPEFVVNPAVYG